MQFALKRMAQDSSHPLGRDTVWQEALIKVLGEEALDLDQLARQRTRALGEQSLPRGLGDFFFDEDHPLHPDR